MPGADRNSIDLSISPNCEQYRTQLRNDGLPSSSTISTFLCCKNEQDQSYNDCQSCASLPVHSLEKDLPPPSDFEMHLCATGTKKHKTVPPPLNLCGAIEFSMTSDPVHDRLTELAIIATSPQSPLVAKNSNLPRKRSFSLSSLHSYARLPIKHKENPQPSWTSSTLCSPPVSTSEPCSSLTVDENYFHSSNMTPEDTSAAYTLSIMATQHWDSPSASTPPPSPTKPYEVGFGKSDNGSNNGVFKAKRPMNGFMLFARKFRVEYSQMYPGKDNRAISVLLGDHWHKLTSNERDAYSQQARILAEERKKLHPDCWKRKRSLSSSS